MAGFEQEIVYARNIDLSGGSQVSAQLLTDGQMLIASTALNAGNTHVNVGNIVAADSSVTIGYVSPDITIKVNTSVVAETITGDTGGALPPTLGNWNILGQQASTIAVMDTIGSGSTLRIEDRTRISAFVVDPSSAAGLRGTFTTIQTAITAAVSGQTIYIRPGSYAENLTMKAGVTLVAMLGDALDNNVQISGSITCTYSGVAAIGGCKLIATTSGGIILSGAAGTQLNLTSCTVYQFSGAGTHYSYASSNAANSANFINCLFDTDAFGTWFNVSGGGVQLSSCVFQNTGGSSSANLLSAGAITLVNTTYGIGNTILPPWTVSGGTFTAVNSTINGPVTTSSGAVLEIDNCRCYTANNTCFTVGGGASNIFNSVLFSGSGSAISVTAATSLNAGNLTVESTNTNAITGAGTIYYGGISYVGPTATYTINTTTQVPSVGSNDALNVVTPGAYPYTTVPQDEFIKVDTSSARTIVPLASPTTGQKHIIKDTVGSASANNITITPSGKNIDGAASFVISSNYGSITIVYNGSEWSVT